MLIFIHGEDSYSSRQYLNKVIEQFKTKHDMQGKSVLIFDSDDSTWEQISGALTAEGLFSSKKLIITKDLVSNKELRESLKEYLDSSELPDSSTLIVYESSAVDKRSSLVKHLSKEKYANEFKAPEPYVVEQMISAMAQEQGKSIDPSATRELAGICGADLWRARSEVSKLSNLVDTTITIADVKEHTQGKLEDNIWKFVDSISLGNKKQALDMLETQLQLGTQPMYLLAMMIRQFRLLIALYKSDGSDSHLASTLKLHPFVVKKTRQQAARFTIDQLKAIYQSLARLDSALKTGKGEAKLLFTVLIDSVVK
jgi:DNA polymerase III subunit delta